jgi:DNA-binding PadR family transcriptional regulator
VSFVVPFRFLFHSFAFGYGFHLAQSVQTTFESTPIEAHCRLVTQKNLFSNKYLAQRYIVVLYIGQRRKETLFMSDRFQRDLLRGSLDLMVLSVLNDGSKYGYLIQKQISEASGNRITLAAGTLYPLLHRVEEDKLIRSRWDESTGRGRKWYEITAAGKHRLQKQAQDWKEYARCMEQILVSLQPLMPKPI